MILEKEKYRYQQFISDISGNDIRAHQNDPEIAVKNVRDWLRINTLKNMRFSSEIWLAYNEFESDFNQIMQDHNLNIQDINSIPFTDLIDLMKEWIKGWRER